MRQEFNHCGNSVLKLQMELIIILLTGYINKLTRDWTYREFQNMWSISRAYLGV
jgi:hypothetical protein